MQPSPRSESFQDRDIALVDLLRVQGALARLAGSLPSEDVATQYHPDLSPIGWHLGHCVLVERYWLREVVLDEPADTSLHALYFPEQSDKPSRAARLPGRDELVEWARRMQERHWQLLAAPTSRLQDHPLMRDDYLLHFLHQHHAQHLETMHYVLTQRALATRSSADATPATGGADHAQGAAPETVTLAAGTYRVGADDIRSYDNERMPHDVRLGPVDLALRPVDVASWRAFIAAGGYQADALWCPSGLEWRRRHAVDRPATWLDASGRCVATPNGLRNPEAHEPVDGISHYEARAFAHWAGARLPHEHEWEAAAGRGLLAGAGAVWEWCDNTLHTYPGFRAYPYEGYTVPWCDGRHHVLRGGSRWTSGAVRRPSFRNFFEADKRHQHAGLRLAFESPARGGCRRLRPG